MEGNRETGRDAGEESGSGTQRTRWLGRSVAGHRRAAGAVTYVCCV